MLDAPGRGRRCAVAGAEPGDVAPERVERGAVLLDEGAVRGAARQRLEAERAGAGEEIGDLQPLEAAEPAGEHREQAFAGAVAGRAGGVARRRLDRAARATRRR